MLHGPRHNKEAGMYRRGFFPSRGLLLICVGLFCIGGIILPAAAANTTVTATATTVPVTTATTAPLPPVASFFGSPTSGTAPLTVGFTDTSANSPKLWSWNFGDGNTSTAENPSNTYTTAGVYPVSLTATNAAGANTATQTGYITVSAAPVASFYASETSGTAPLTVQFTDTSTNSPASWLWDFGDGNTSTTQNPEKTYATAGVYTVSLTVTSTAGSNTDTETGYITVGDVPAASFYASETSGTAPLTVQFTDTSTNSPTSWSWNFGDGETSVEQSPSHTYSDPGTYTVSLTVVNNAGSNKATETDYVEVSTSAVTQATVATTQTPTPVPTFPEISFSGTPTAGTAPLTVQFTLSASGSPTSLLWDFGDGGTSTESNPSYTYIIPGTYSVILTAKYPGGSKPVTKLSYITVNPGSGSTGSPLSPLIPLGAIGIMVVVSFMKSGKKRQ